VAQKDLLGTVIRTQEATVRLEWLSHDVSARAPRSLLKPDQRVVLTTFAKVGERNVSPGRHLRHQAMQIVGIEDRLPTECRDHVTGPQASTLGRGSLADSADVSSRSGDARVFLRLGGGIGDGSAELGLGALEQLPEPWLVKANHGLTVDRDHRYTLLP
jgi:hypothetical protein